MASAQGKIGLVVALWIAGVCGAAGQAAPPSAGTLPTLQAQLLKTVDAAHAKASDEVQAKTYTPLEFGAAKVPAGSMVLGHVTEAAPDRLVLLFDRIAINKNSPLAAGLSLRAVMMMHPGPSSPGQSGGEISPRAETGGGGTGVDQAIQHPASRGDMLRSPEAAAADSSNTVFAGGDSKPPAPQVVETRNGGVIGVPGLHLTVSADPGTGAVFETAKNQKLKLEKGLLLMFVVSEPARKP